MSEKTIESKLDSQLPDNKETEKEAAYRKAFNATPSIEDVYETCYRMCLHLNELQMKFEAKKSELESCDDPEKISLLANQNYGQLLTSTITELDEIMGSSYVLEPKKTWRDSYIKLSPESSNEFRLCAFLELHAPSTATYLNKQRAYKGDLRKKLIQPEFKGEAMLRGIDMDKISPEAQDRIVTVVNRMHKI